MEEGGVTVKYIANVSIAQLYYLGLTALGFKWELVKKAIDNSTNYPGGFAGDCVGPWMRHPIFEFVSEIPWDLNVYEESQDRSRYGWSFQLQSGDLLSGPEYWIGSGTSMKFNKDRLGTDKKPKLLKDLVDASKHEEVAAVVCYRGQMRSDLNTQILRIFLSTHAFPIPGNIRPDRWVAQAGLDALFEKHAKHPKQESLGLPKLPAENERAAYCDD